MLKMSRVRIFYGMCVLMLLAAVLWLLVKKEQGMQAQSFPSTPLPVPTESMPKQEPSAPKSVPMPEPRIKRHTSQKTAQKAMIPTPLSKPPAAAVVPVPPVAPIATPPPQPLEWQGHDTAITHSGQVVIRNDRQWIAFWAEHHPHEAAPDVDFTRQMVVGVFAGERPADAFTIRIVEARPQGKALIVEYREQTPPPGTFQIGVSVFPYDLKVVPRSDLSVKFRQINF